MKEYGLTPVAVSFRLFGRSISTCGQHHQGHDHEDRQSGQDRHGEWARVHDAQRAPPAGAAGAEISLQRAFTVFN